MESLSPYRWIEWNGLYFPPEVRGHWEREDGLTVDIVIEVEADSDPVVTSFTVTKSTGILTERDFRLPMMLLRRRTLEYSGAEKLGPGEFSFPGIPQRIATAAKTPNDRERFARVAELYNRARDQEFPVTTYIEEHMHVSRRTAEDLIYKARKAGFDLPPAKRGPKKRRSDDGER